MIPRAVTSPELALLRKDGQWSELFLAVLVPQTIYTARLSALPTSFDMVAEISYNTGSGTLANVKVGMTMYIGSTAGAHDLGMVRIRKTPGASAFYIGEQSKVTWAANAYLTVVEDFDLWAKHIHMNGTTTLMDYDVAYSNQHTVFNPVPVLGSHRVAKLTGATVAVTLGCDTANGQASWVIGSTISAYSWSVPSATGVTGGTTANPVATFNSTGWKACYCTVTAANGATKQGMRWVYVYSDANPPATVFELKSLDEAYDSGGATAGLTLADEASLPEIRERSLCILFSVDHYGRYNDRTDQSIGQVTHCENIRMVGRVGDEGIDYENEYGTVSFELQGYQYWLEKINTFPVGVEIASNTPAAWTDMPALTVDRGLWHLLEWRSTATTIMDIALTGDTRYTSEVSAYTGNLRNMMEEFAFSQIMAHVNVDTLGRLFAEIDPQIIPEASRATSVRTVMTLTKDDFQSGVEIDKQVVPDTSLVDVSGISVDQYGGSPLSYFAVSPGHVFGEYGGYEIIDRLLLTSQAQCTQLAGLIYGWRINKYKGLSINLTGNNNMIGCFPNQYIVFQVEADDSPRGEAFTMNFIVRSRSISFDNQTGAWDYQLELEAESFEENAVAYIPPDGSDISIPPLPSFPPLPPYVPFIPGDTSGSDDGPPDVWIYAGANGLLYTADFDSASPTWQFWNNGIDPADLPYLVTGTMFTTPSGGCYIAAWEKQFTRWYDRVYYAASMGATWSKIIDQTYLNSICGPGDRNGKIYGLGFNPTVSNEVAMIIGDDSNRRFMLGNHAGFTQKSVYGVGNTNFPGGLTFGVDKWIHDLNYAGNEWWQRFSAIGAPIDTPHSFGQGFFLKTARVGTSAIIYKYHPGVTDTRALFRSPDNGTTLEQVYTPADPGNGFADNPVVSFDDTAMFAAWTTNSRRGRSFDQGYSWDGSFFTYGDRYRYAYAGGSQTSSDWILARGVIRFSSNGGGDWTAKEGNLPYLIPTGLDISKIVIPSMFAPAQG